MSSANNDVEPPSKKKKTEAPSYGSQEYWDLRYERQFQALTSGKVEKMCNSNNKDEDTLPYHAWYFTYHELRPLLLPLILGGRQEAIDIIIHGNSEKECDAANDNTDETKPGETDGVTGNKPQISNENDHKKDEDSSDGISNEEDGHDEAEDNNFEVGGSDDFEEVEGSDSEDEEEELIHRDGLAKDGPISVVEIGCGDVPLGAGLAFELKNLESQTDTLANNIIKRIVCTDYSEILVTAMKEQYSRQQPSCNDDLKDIPWVDIRDIPLEFATADARKLPYPDESFELVLEKGTLDAMLSDNESGVSSSIAIVKECARVLAIGGYIMLISHLNAHTPRGIGWLEGVVFKGLRAGGGNAVFEIEVHGNDDVAEDEDACAPPGSSGPAVYIINKKHAKQDAGKMEEQQTIPVKFFSY